MKYVDGAIEVEGVVYVPQDDYLRLWEDYWAFRLWRDELLKSLDNLERNPSHFIDRSSNDE